MGVRLLETAARDRGGPTRRCRPTRAARRGRRPDRPPSSADRSSLLALLEQAPRDSGRPWTASSTRRARARRRDDRACSSSRGLSPDRLEAFVTEAEARCLRRATGSCMLETAEDLPVAPGRVRRRSPGNYRRLRAVLTRLETWRTVWPLPHAGEGLMQSASSKVSGSGSAAAADRRRPGDGPRVPVGRCRRVRRRRGRGDAESAANGHQGNTLLSEASFLFADRTTSRSPTSRREASGSASWRGPRQVSLPRRCQGSAGEQFDLAINVNRELSGSQIEEEIDWLIVCAANRGEGSL